MHTVGIWNPYAARRCNGYNMVVRDVADVSIK